MATLFLDNIIGFCILVSILGIVVFLLWYFLKYLPIYKSRNKPIITRYEPPRGLTAAQVGIVYLRKSDLNKLVIAEMTALSELGYITIAKKRRGDYVGYILSGIFVSVFLAIFGLGIIYLLARMWIQFYSPTFMFFATYSIVGIVLLQVLYKRVIKPIKNFFHNTYISDFTFNTNVNPVPDHLIDLVDFLKTVQANQGERYFFYKRLLKDFFNRVLASLPKDHIEERSIFGKKHYPTSKPSSLRVKLSWFFGISLFAWPLYLFFGVFLYEKGVLHFIKNRPTDVLYIIGVLALVRILFIIKKYLTNRIFYKTNLWYEVMGFRHYLDIAEEDRIKFFNNPQNSLEVYSKFLPYAIVFGLENKWKNIFTPILGIRE